MAGQLHLHGEKRPSRRDLLRLLGAGTSAAFLAACMPAPAASPQTSAGEPGADADSISIRFWHNAGGRQELYEGQAAAFTQQNPNIQIEVVFQGSGGDVFQKAQASLAAGDPPESTFASPTFLPPLAEDGIVVDLTPYLEADAAFNRDDISPVLWEAAAWNNKIVMAPKDFQAWVLYYNQEIFDQAGLTPPTNWQEFEEAAVQLTQDTDGDGNPDVYGFDFWTSMRENWLSFLYNNGGSFLAADSTSEVAFDEAPGQEALALFGRLLENRAAPESPVEQGFQSGRVAMLMSGTWWVKNFLEVESPFGVTRVPFQVEPKAHVNINGWAMWKTDDVRQDATWQWLSFILSKENYESQIQSEYWIPIRESHKNDPEFKAWLEDVPQLKVQVEMPTAEFQPPPVTMAGAQPLSILGETLEAALLGQRPLETALEEAAAEIEAVLADANS